MVVRVAVAARVVVARVLETMAVVKVAVVRVTAARVVGTAARVVVIKVEAKVAGGRVRVPSAYRPSLGAPRRGARPPGRSLR